MDGVILSDHRAYVNKAAKSDLPETPLSEMTAEDIDSALQNAWLHSKAVSMLLASLYDSKFLPLIEGAVIGCTEGQVTLLQKHPNIRTIDVADIRHGDVLAAEKWWNQDSEQKGTTHMEIRRSEKRQRQLHASKIEPEKKRTTKANARNTISCTWQITTVGFDVYRPQAVLRLSRSYSERWVSISS